MSGLDRLQSEAAPFEIVLRLLVELGDAGVYIPAVVVEFSVLVDNIDQGFPLHTLQAYDHVGNLDAGVIEVVLHFDSMAQEAQTASERVAQRGIAQVADVR